MPIDRPGWGIGRPISIGSFEFLKLVVVDADFTDYSATQLLSAFIAVSASIFVL